MKRRTVGFLLAAGWVAFTGAGEFDRLLAQNSTSYISGHVYQGGRNGQIKQTTSYVSLPNLNEILAPTPVNPPQQRKPQPQVQTYQPQAKPYKTVTTSTHRVVTRSKTNTTPQRTQPTRPAPPVTSSVPTTGPTGYDDLTTPIDPGYDARQVEAHAEEAVPQTHFQFPVAEKAQRQVEETDKAIHYHQHTHTHTHNHTHNHYYNQPAQQPQQQQVVPQQQQPQFIHQQNLSYPQFAHNYYPRTYYYRYPITPYYTFPRSSYYSYPYSFNRYHYYGSPYSSIYRSRAPLRGSLTSSINYLSGFRRPAARFRFIF